MIFTKARVTNVTANIGKGEIRITFLVDLDELEEAMELADYQDKDAGWVTLDVLPYQLKMKYVAAGGHTDIVMELPKDHLPKDNEEPDPNPQKGEWHTDEELNVTGEPNP